MEEIIMEKINIDNLHIEGEENGIAVSEENLIEPKECEIEKEVNKKLDEFGIVIKGNLNMRKRPSIKSDIIKVIEDGSKVKILPNKDSTFYKVKFGDAEGYCMKKFIRKV